jgi:hypothetical protein
MLPELTSDMGFRDRGRLLTRISTLPIKFITRAIREEISPGGGAIKTTDGQKQWIAADSFILAAGAKQNNILYPLLKAKGFKTHLAGDCWRLGRIAGAISDGLRLGCIL